MQVRVIRECFFTRENRRVQAGEIVTVPGRPEKAIRDGMVEPVIPVPENVPDMPGTYD